MPPLISELVIVSAFNTLHFGIIKEACPSCAPQLLSSVFLSLVCICVCVCVCVCVCTCVCVCLCLSVISSLSEGMVGGAVVWLYPQKGRCLPLVEGASPHPNLFVVVSLPARETPLE